MFRFVLFLLAAAGLAQERPTFSTSTQMVVETVRVRDKQGRPVEGLTAGDFLITEDGAPQTVAFVEFQRIDAAAPPPAEPYTARAAAVPRLTRTRIAGEPPGEIKYRDTRLLAFYFDFSAMPPPDQSRALAAAQRFVRTQMSAADRVAILQYSGGAVEVLEDFTADRARLLVTLQTLLLGEEPETAANPGDATATDTGAAFGQNDGEFNLFTTDRQLAALQTAAAMLGRLSEKKALVYFSSGLRLNGLDNQAQLRATLNAAVRAGVALWPIDARGLVAQAPMGDARRGSPGGSAMYTGEAAQLTNSRLLRSQDTLYSLAAETGGKATLDQNDLAQGITAARDSFGSYYLLGYYTTNGNADGRFRKVRITLARPGEYTIDYRQGYYAPKQFARFTTADKERQLEEALLLEDPMTELTMAVEVNYFQLNRAEYFVPVALKIPGSELAQARRRGATRSTIDFLGEIRESGVTVANLRDKVELKLDGATARELERRPIAYDAGFTLLPGTYTLKLLARDAETGRIGTILATFTIPNLARETRRVATSSVVLSSQRVPMDQALYSTRDKLKAQALNPLIEAGEKLLPSVTRVFRRERPLELFWQAYAAGPGTVGYLTFYRDGHKVFETPPAAAAELPGATLATRSWRFPVSLAALEPGEYLCQVTVLDAAARRAAFWQATIAVIP